MKLKVLGVHTINAQQPCHLVEVEISEYEGKFDVGVLVQPRMDGKSDFEQAPYMEHLLDASGESGEPTSYDIEVQGQARIAFFMHYLEENWRLRSPVGEIELPPATPLPLRLTFIEYYELS